jgi:hypothetical protein
MCPCWGSRTTRNSSHLRGAADGPPLIRRVLHDDAYTSWSETGVDLGADGRLVTTVTSTSTGAAMPGTSSNSLWGGRWSPAIP